VVASATVSAKPDQAEIVLGVTTFQKTASAAVAENQKRMERLLAALKKEIGTDGEVSTSDFSVQQELVETRSGEETGKVRGYRVTNTIQAKVASVQAVGRLLDSALQAGANNVERVAFTLKDPESARNQALRLASLKARAKATAMAEGQGLHVGEVVSMTEDGGSTPFEAIENNEGFKMKRANISSESGSLEVTGTVTVTFALKAR